MPDLMRAKLGAYLDGELAGRSLLEMQTHLQTCPGCQAELAELQQLSQLLHTAPLPEFTPAGRFVANLLLQLPRRPAAPQAASPTPWFGWLIPLGLLAAWVFIEVTVRLAALLTWAGQSGWLGQSAAWLNPGQRVTLWFSATRLLLGDSLNLAWLNEAGLFLQNLAGPFFWQATVAVLYVAWLAYWWASQRNANGSDLVEPVKS